MLFLSSLSLLARPFSPLSSLISLSLQIRPRPRGASAATPSAAGEPPLPSLPLSPLALAPANLTLTSTSQMPSTTWRSPWMEPRASSSTAPWRSRAPRRRPPPTLPTTRCVSTHPRSARIRSNFRGSVCVQHPGRHAGDEAVDGSIFFLQHPGSSQIHGRIRVDGHYFVLLHQAHVGIAAAGSAAVSAKNIM